MDWLSYVLPQLLIKTSSRFNLDIRVVKDAGKNKLMVNGIHESSEYIAKFWSQAIKRLEVNSKMRVKNILIFGVAGGTVIHMLSKIFPHAHMLGVDIDTTMIDLGKKYFDLDQISNLSFVTADAKKYVQAKHEQVYDLIVVDIYIGRDLPDFLRDQKFLFGVEKNLVPGGYVLMNYLRDGEYEKKAKDLEKKLQKAFPHVTSADYLNNRFFLARK